MQHQMLELLKEDSPAKKKAKINMRGKENKKKENINVQQNLKENPPKNIKIRTITTTIKTN